MMCTTIDLDPDVNARLREVARRRGLPLRAVINEVLRAGIPRDTQPYVMPTFRLGIRPVDLDKALQLAAADEDDEISSPTSA